MLQQNNYSSKAGKELNRRPVSSKMLKWHLKDALENKKTESQLGQKIQALARKLCPWSAMVPLLSQLWPRPSLLLAPFTLLALPLPPQPWFRGQPTALPHPETLCELMSFLPFLCTQRRDRCNAEDVPASMSALCLLKTSPWYLSPGSSFPSLHHCSCPPGRPQQHLPAPPGRCRTSPALLPPAYPPTSCFSR